MIEATRATLEIRALMVHPARRVTLGKTVRLVLMVPLGYRVLRGRMAIPARRVRKVSRAQQDRRAMRGRLGLKVPRVRRGSLARLGRKARKV